MYFNVFNVSVVHLSRRTCISRNNQPSLQDLMSGWWWWRYISQQGFQTADCSRVTPLKIPADISIHFCGDNPGCLSQEVRPFPAVIVATKVVKPLCFPDSNQVVFVCKQNQSINPEVWQERNGNFKVKISKSFPSC